MVDRFIMCITMIYIYIYIYIYICVYIYLSLLIFNSLLVEIRTEDCDEAGYVDIDSEDEAQPQAE